MKNSYYCFLLLLLLLFLRCLCIAKNECIAVLYSKEENKIKIKETSGCPV